MLKRGALWIAAAVCLTACPSSRANNAGDVSDGSVRDVGDGGIAPPDVGIRMEFTFTSASFNGSAGGMSLRANMVWHGNLRGDAGGIQFEGDFR
jgi:hypothetical protein